MLTAGECYSCGGAYWELCPQCKTWVKCFDFDPRAGMCGACISEAMAEAPEYFSTRGLVASAEENEHND